MAPLRACLLIFALFSFFLVGAPLQGLLARRRPRWAERIPKFFCWSLLKIMRVDLVVAGARVEDRPVLIAANHVSWIDILAFGSIMPICFVAKGEVGSWPILSALAKVQGTVFLNRKRKRTIPASNRQMAMRMLEGRAVLLFPEGTTVGKPGPARFLTSHFASARDLLRIDPSFDHVAIQPVAVDYSSEAAAWIGDDDLVSHTWRTLRSPPLRCFIGFGAPLDYGVETNRKVIALHAREAVMDMIESSDLGGVTALRPLAPNAVGEPRGAAAIFVR